MTATLTFDLSSPDDRDQHTLAVAAPSLYATLCEHDMYLRNRLKYEALSRRESKVLQAARDALLTTCEKFNVSVDMVS